MSWTRSKDKNTGLFSYEVRDYQGVVFKSGHGFVDYRDADMAAQIAERQVHLQNSRKVDPVIEAMSDEELLDALLK